jgi:hypothetical protein
MTERRRCPSTFDGFNVFFLVLYVASGYFALRTTSRVETVCGIEGVELSFIVMA